METTRFPNIFNSKRTKGKQGETCIVKSEKNTQENGTIDANFYFFVNVHDVNKRNSSKARQLWSTGVVVPGRSSTNRQSPSSNGQTM